MLVWIVISVLGLLSLSLIITTSISCIKKRKLRQQEITPNAKASHRYLDDEEIPAEQKMAQREKRLDLIFSASSFTKK